MAEDEKTLKYKPSMYSSITYDTLMKLHVHNQIMVIYTQYKFNEIPFNANKEWLRRENQSNGNNPSLSNDNPMKRHVNNHTMVIHVYVHYIFFEIPFIGYKVRAENRFYLKLLYNLIHRNKTSSE